MRGTTATGPTLIQVGTLKDQLRRLPAELQGHLLQVALRGGRHDLAAGHRAAGERDLVDALVRGEGCPADRADRRHRVDDAGWETVSR